MAEGRVVDTAEALESDVLFNAAAVLIRPGAQMWLQV